MKSGIYSISNHHTGDCYIGSTNNLLRRKSEHFSALRNGRHINPYLQKAFSKYGEDAFEWCVLENCTDADLLKCEQHYLDSVSPAYNLASIAGGRFRTGKPVSEENKAKLSAFHTGKTISPETRELLRQSSLGKKHTEATKKKVSEAAKASWQRIEYRENLSEKRRQMWQNDEKRKTMGGKVTAHLLANREQLSESRKAWHAANPVSYSVLDTLSGKTTLYDGAKQVAFALGISTGLLFRYIKQKRLLRQHYLIQKTSVYDTNS